MYPLLSKKKALKAVKGLEKNLSTSKLEQLAMFPLVPYSGPARMKVLNKELRGATP